jgi:hypothetical protein
MARRAYEHCTCGLTLVLCLSALLPACTYVKGPCTHTETVIVETTCGADGKAGTARPLPGR